MKQITLKGKKYASVREAIRETLPAVNEGTIRNRIDRGWSAEKAFFEPKHDGKTIKQKVYEKGGNEQEYRRVLKRIQSGMDPKSALVYPYRGVGQKKGLKCVVHSEEFQSLHAACDKFNHFASEATIRRWIKERGYTYPTDLAPLFEEVPKPGLSNGSIYMITFKGSKPNKYIGQTINTVQRRFQKHCHDALSGQSDKLHRAMKLYGIENFDIEVLETGISNKLDGNENYDTLSRRETYYIEKYDTYHPNGFNVQKPSRGGGSISSQISIPFKARKKTFPTHKEACKWLAEELQISYEAAKGRIRTFKRTGDSSRLYRDPPNSPGQEVYRTSEYKAWSLFKGEKCNPKSKNYERIPIDNAMSKFARFLEIVGNKPGKDYQLQLINQRDGFVVGNVEWRLRGTLAKNHPNTLRSRYPELAKTWASDNPVEITPDNVSHRSSRTVKWAELKGAMTYCFEQRIAERVDDYEKSLKQNLFFGADL